MHTKTRLVMVCGNRNFMQPMRRLRGFSIFLLCLEGGGNILLFVYCQCVLEVNFHGSNVGAGWVAKEGEHDKACFHFGEGSIFKLLYRGQPHLPKILVLGQSNGSFRKLK